MTGIICRACYQHHICRILTITWLTLCRHAVAGVTAGEGWERKRIGMMLLMRKRETRKLAIRKGGWGGEKKSSVRKQRVRFQS